MTVRVVSYEVEGWGIGELWLDGEVLVAHELPRARASRARPAADGLAERFRAYFTGAPDTFADVELDLEWATPFSATVTYGELAALAGSPNAYRAAGSVCAGNRFPLVVPCHRVVAASGIGPYGPSGTEYKRRLLELEGVAL
jgi:O-6-methylguanine DNA methyltransferase